MRLRATSWWLVVVLVTMVVVPVPVGAAVVSPFSDVPDSDQFVEAVAWLADQGITRGCNPPTNDRFCPDEAVTRGQMAAFLGRALFLRDGVGSDSFGDDNGSVFEADIERLAEAGITKGCNPPTNDEFCPDAVVTRGQMAAFLVRAFGYVDSGGQDFVDDNGSVFEADIERLAAAGVTKGCNPPANDRFCPNDPVTRAQMAAFLHRAFGNPTVGEPGVNRVDSDITVVLGGDDVASGSVAADGSGTLTVAEGTPVPAVGKFLIASASDELPTGLVGQVAAVSGHTIETELVALSKVIPEAIIDTTVDLGELQRGDVDLLGLFGFSCGLTNVDADIDFGASATINFAAEWGPFREDYVRFTANLVLQADLEGGGGIHTRCTRILAQGAQLAPVPLPFFGLSIQPHLEIVGEINGAIEAFTFDVGAGVTATTGFEWREGKTTPSTTSLPTPTLSSLATTPTAGPSCSWERGSSAKSGAWSGSTIRLAGHVRRFGNQGARAQGRLRPRGA